MIETYIAEIALCSMMELQDWRRRFVRICHADKRDTTASNPHVCARDLSTSTIDSLLFGLLMGLPG
jgi:hypothetical protein